jgi:ABC-2 type transport system ATP-binding protein
MTIDDGMALRVQSLSVRYDEVTVLAGIDVTIPRGAVVALVGRNGAGKSTLLRCMVGLSVPERGEVNVLGCPALALDDPTRARIGYVGQTPDLLDWVSVWEHVRYIGSFYAAWDERRARELLIRFGLADDRRVAKLSVGEQQKLSIVLALAHDPELVLMDEPVASLDPLARRDFLRALFERRAEQDARTVVLSSHLLTDLERVASHVLFLRDGTLQWFGEHDALSEHVRVLALGAALPLQPGLLSQRRVGDGWQAVVDTRLCQPVAPHNAGRAMNLDDLFVELNT